MIHIDNIHVIWKCRFFQSFSKASEGIGDIDTSTIDGNIDVRTMFLHLFRPRAKQIHPDIHLSKIVYDHFF